MSKKTQPSPKKPLTHTLSQPIETEEYTVSLSDTLPGIAARFDTTPSELTKLNKLVSRLIFPGQVLLVPKKTSDADVEKESDVNQQTPAAEQRKNSAEGKDLSSLSSKKEADLQSDSSPSQLQKNDNIPRFVKLSSRYITDGQGVVSGVLMMTTNAIMFDPNVSDPLVIEHDVENYGVIAPIDMVMKAAIYFDIAHMAVSHHFNEVPRNIPKPEMYIKKKNGLSDKNSCPTENKSFGANQVQSQQISSSPLNASVSKEPEQLIQFDKNVKNADNLMKSRKVKSSEHINEIFGEPEQQISPIKHDTSFCHRKNDQDRNTKSKLFKTQRAHSVCDSVGFNQVKNEREQAKKHIPHTHLPKSKTSKEDVYDPSKDSIEELDTENEFEFVNRDLSLTDLDADRQQPQSFIPSEIKSVDITQLSLSSYDYLSLEEKKDKDIFESLDQIIVSRPRPATCFNPPLYLCLRMGHPINKKVKKSSPFLAYHKKRVKREYWFSISRDKVDEVYEFFEHWFPHLYGDILSIEPEKLGFTPIVDEEDRDMEYVDEEEITQESTNNSFEGAIKIFRSSPLSILKVVEDHFGGGNITKEEWEFLSMNESEKSSSPSSGILEFSLPDTSDQSDILDDEQKRQLCKCLPPRTFGYCWTLIYSTSKHGFSLKTLYRKMYAIETPILLAICDTNGAVFGALSSSALKMHEHFYGTGESFLYSFNNGFKYYPWTGENMYFIKGNPESLAFGAGEGHFGLWLDGDLYHGRSRSCRTFNNECLSSQEDFFIKTLEAWGFV